MNKRFESFGEFYPFYLSQHVNKTCRALHYVGSSLVVVILIYALLSHQWWILGLLPVIGYGFAWIGHFVFEKNRPATFKYPLYSFMADWLMLFKALTSRK
ncbi:membrane protein-like protein [Shewanella halifaxensis HAW-EB4]|uniref:Membrane protein-like protein n=1 Tax=Shewanella halifaxensis (strain HAW-EB4) TaxID=458817 RepID=B0TP94_SHEHH|nr:DUF962 domain-containing protein [Shewanella halifaxensis]ABZ77541.1 membrane protein-like protein [Shewanella halifaxensis HAW-EB4]